jgi:hypothetical protein
MSVGVAPLACPNTERATLSYQPQSKCISDSDRLNKFTSLKRDLWRPGIEFEKCERRLNPATTWGMYGHYGIHWLPQLWSTQRFGKSELLYLERELLYFYSSICTAGNQNHVPPWIPYFRNYEILIWKFKILELVVFLVLYVVREKSKESKRLFLRTSPCGGGLEYFHRNPCES